MPFILVVVIGIPILLIVFGYDPENPPTLQDIGLNLLAEALGIVVTVSIIERLIKSSEEAQRVPHRNLVYARLTKYLSEFILYSTPPDRLIPNFELLEKVYIYGEVYAQPTTYSRPSAQEYQAKLPEIVATYSQKINSVLDLTGFLLEPKLLMLLHEFKDYLDDIQFSKGPMDDDLEMQILMAGLKAANVRGIVMKNATREITQEELIKEMSAELERINLAGSPVNVPRNDI
jgi:hypothetical protein